MNMHKHIMDEFFTSLTSFGTPLFYALIIIIVSRFNFNLAILILITLVITEIVGGIIKLVYPSDRPIPRKRTSLYEKYDAGTFPSIHTARISALAIMINFYYFDYALLACSILLVLGVGYSRVYLKHHYSIDVIGGFILGAIISIIMRLWQNGFL
ncbi:phosphatase PAP2 family protein [Candidatus Woesearchaeota archaeon]|nr:phosphatase PAP2 family protein [Candidatus Woesearchaeota archaeon]